MQYLPSSNRTPIESQRNLRCVSGYRRWVAGSVLPILAVLAVLISCDSSLASCAHYVQDRFHPAVTSESNDTQIGQSWGFLQLQPTKRQPCRNGECRAPQLPPAPASVSVIIVPENVRTNAVPGTVRFTFELSSRPSFDRPHSERISGSSAANILKPPC